MHNIEQFEVYVTDVSATIPKQTIPTPTVKIEKM